MKANLRFLIMALLLSQSCSKPNTDINPPSNILGNFTAIVSQRTANTAQIDWNTPVNPNNNDAVKFKIYLNGRLLASDVLVNSWQLSGLLPGNSYSGKVLAYTQSGDTSSAAFSVNTFTAPPAYSYLNGYYKVTESSRILSTGQTSNYVFFAEANLQNDSTIKFVQSRRIPYTWWTVDYQAEIYPSLNDSIIGGGITPRGRILDSNTVRIKYIFGSTLVYEVSQLWEKLPNPSDTAAITYTYPSFPNMINTVAGNNTSGAGSGSSGDGGLAVKAALLNPADVTLDQSGNVYVTDGGSSSGYSIRRIAANGIITRFAGNNTSGHSGDGGAAINAQINYPQGLASDLSGNIYISDAGNRVIRKVNASGTISTIAGIPGSYGFSGDGGAATSAQLTAPAGIATDAAGNIFFADPGRHIVRKIDVNGIISTIAGTPATSGGYSGDGGQASSATLNYPTDVALDNQGNLFIADRDNHCIRKVNASGIITTVAGIAGSLNYGFTGDGGSALSAKLNKPNSISVDAMGNLFISDNSNNRIRRVTSAGIISTIAGNGQSAVPGDGPDFFGGDFGPATSASLFAPYGNYLVNGKLYVVSSYRVRRIVL